MKIKYRIRGNGRTYWIQERVLFWWEDVLQVNEYDQMRRKEYPTLQEAYFQMARFVALDYIHKRGIVKTGSTAKGD